jgi:perosamine synthetase
VRAVRRIPVFEPVIDEDDVQAVAETVRRGEVSGAFGATIPAFEQAFAEFCGVKHGVAVSNGTTALHLAVAEAGIGRGDEVLVSASTNIATALAPYHCGAVTVPVDSEPDTWNLDLSLLEELITERTRAIIPVHLFGHPVDMDELCEIARHHDLLVIEDAAEAHGAEVRGRRCGSFGDANCFSFFANKVITTGEGGMVMTDDDDRAERLRYLRNLAHGEPRFLHLEPGFNFRMTGYQAALGLSQLRRIDEIIEAKRRVAQAYDAVLAGVPGIQTPVEKDWARNVYWMYAIVVGDDYPLSRDELARALARDGIDSSTFFCPMNQQPFLREQPGYRDVPCPVADRLWETGLYLPSAPSLTSGHIERVAACIDAAVTA